MEAGWLCVNDDRSVSSDLWILVPTITGLKMSEKTVNVDLDLEKAWKSIAEDHFKYYQDHWLLMNKKQNIKK